MRLHFPLRSEMIINSVGNMTVQPSNTNWAGPDLSKPHTYQWSSQGLSVHALGACMS